MTTATEVLALQTELVQRLDGSLGRYLEGVLQDSRELRDPDGVGMAVGQSLAMGRAYRVQENMTPAIWERAREIPATARFAPVSQAGDPTVIAPPRLTGFVVMEEPLRFREAMGFSSLAHMLTWTMFISDDDSAQGWLVTIWNDRYREPDEVLDKYPDHEHSFDARRHEEVFGRWAPIGGRFLISGREVGPLTFPADQRQKEKALRLGCKVNEENLNVGALTAGLWLLLGETVPAPHRDTVEVTEEHVPKTARRRAAREGLDDPGVSTVVLRRERRPTAHPGTGKPQSSRVWVEGGFTRRYWVGPKGKQVAVTRKIGGHWSNNDESLPVRERRVVSELRR
jgi:hypothetical protein